MFFRHSKTQRPRDAKANGSCGDFPQSLVNPLYKPKTLGELKALMVHTGINPAPQPLRPALPETPGVDSMDSPAIPVTGDTFEIIRRGEQIQRELAAGEAALADDSSAPAAAPDSSEPSKE